MFWENIVLTASIYESVNHTLKLNSLLATNPQICSKKSKIKFWFIKEKKHKKMLFWNDIYILNHANKYIHIFCVFISYHPGGSMKMKFDHLKIILFFSTPPKFWQYSQGLLSTFELLWIHKNYLHLQSTIYNLQTTYLHYISPPLTWSGFPSPSCLTSLVWWLSRPTREVWWLGRDSSVWGFT